jgi:hypothetical protein
MSVRSTPSTGDAGAKGVLTRAPGGCDRVRVIDRIAIANFNRDTARAAWRRWWW